MNVMHNKSAVFSLKTSLKNNFSVLVNFFTNRTCGAAMRSVSPRAYILLGH
jgi:hypothetical protein